MVRPITTIAFLAGAAALAAGSAAAGRLSADDDYWTGYVAGVQDGAAQGRMEGRALQENAEGGVRKAFLDGYAAGADDVFAGYDGGWYLSAPYVVTLKRADSPLTYRIASRTLMVPGVTYHLCGDRACESQPR